MNKPTLWWRLIAVAALAALLVLNHYAPLQAEFVALYAGLCVALLGLLCVLVPLRFLGIRRRVTGLLVLGAGVLVVAAALLWPAPTLRSSRPHQRIDDFMPSYSFYEFHETRVNAPPDSVVAAMHRVGLADLPAAVFLMRVRGAAAGHREAGGIPRESLLDLMSRPESGFLVLDASDPREFVGGMAGLARAPKPPIHTPGQFLAFKDPDGIRVAFNVRVSDAAGGGTRLTSETRVVCNGDAGRRLFAGYWRIIYPGSAIIRRVWLDAITDVAQKAVRGA
jgi:hypothetical protein